MMVKKLIASIAVLNASLAIIAPMARMLIVTLIHSRYMNTKMRINSEWMIMKCPVCVIESLVMSERGGVEIDYCPKAERFNWYEVSSTEL